MGFCYVDVDKSQHLISGMCSSDFEIALFQQEVSALELNCQLGRYSLPLI
jgi:hypothetical protein